MTLAADIASTLASVVTALAPGSWHWSTNAAPTTWIAIDAVPSGLREAIAQDEMDETRYAEQTVRIKIAATMPAIRDQFRDPDSLTWEVTAIASQGYGTRSYTIVRGVPVTLGDQRGRVRS